MIMYDYVCTYLFYDCCYHIATITAKLVTYNNENSVHLLAYDNDNRTFISTMILQLTMMIQLTVSIKSPLNHH